MEPPNASLFLLLLTLASVHSDYTWMKEASAHKSNSYFKDPEFEDTPLTVTVQPGQTATLPCRVRYIGDKLVSWIRHKDLSIISSGSLLFTSDSRFRLMHPDGDSASWSLQLRNPTISDQGLYECQVNTEPKMKRSILLVVRVIFPALDQLSLRDDSSAYGRENAVILGPREQYVREGSTVTITCHVHMTKQFYHQRPQRFVDWMFGNDPITSQISGVSVDTEKIGNMISSKLTLTSVLKEDSGVYSCTSQFSNPDSIYLDVVGEDRSEAMIGDPITDSSGYFRSLSPGLQFSVILIFLLHCYLYI